MNKILITAGVLIYMCLFSRISADVWTDYHGTTGTAGIDTGSMFNEFSVLKPPLVLSWSQTDWNGPGMTSVFGSAPVVANGIVYLGAEDHNGTGTSHLLYAWDTSTGNGIPGFPVGVLGDVTTAPAVANGIVYVGSKNDGLYAFNATTGAIIPGFPSNTGGNTYTSPAVSKGIVYVTGNGKKLYAFNAATGAAIAGFPVGADLFSNPVITNGKIYEVSGVDGKLYAWNALTGSAIVGFPITLNPVGGFSQPIVANGIVYVGASVYSASGYKLFAYNAATGAGIAGFPVTMNEPGYGAPSEPAVANGVVYITIYNGSVPDTKIYAFSASTGAIMPGFPVDMNDVCWTSPRIANGYLYINNSYNKVYAIDIADGSIVWQYLMPINGSFAGAPYGGPVIAEDKLFVPCDYGDGIFVFCVPSPTVTPTIIITATYTPTVTPSITVSLTLTVTATITVTGTITSTYTITPTPLPKFRLEVKGNYPAPFSGYTDIVFFVSKSASVEVTIFTVSGEVVVKKQAYYPAGFGKYSWDGSNGGGKKVSSGTYLYRVEAVIDNEKQTSKILKMTCVR